MTNEEAHNIEELKDITAEERAALAEDDAPEAVEESSVEQVDARHDPAPILKARALDNAAVILDRVVQFEEDLARQFEEGDIAARDYAEGLRRAAEKREEVRWAQRKAELASEFTETAQNNAWFREVDRFMSTTGAAIAKSEAAKIAFDEHVKAVTADPANQHLSDRAQLDMAFKLFKQDVGGALGAPALHQPVGQRHGQADVGGGDYSALDRLADADPVAYEAALARMSPAERDRYGF